jgi:hypothetical protein
MSINQSLTYLEQCVVALSRKGTHIPYRQSRLTNILKDALGANCNTYVYDTLDRTHAYAYSHAHAHAHAHAMLVFQQCGVLP